MRRTLPQFAGVLFATVFLIHFWACKLYGTGAADTERRTRWEVAAGRWFADADAWKRVIPLLTPEATPEFLEQRIMIWAPAFGIWLLALAAGEMLLFAAAGLRAPRGWERFALAHGLGMGAVSLLTLGIGLAGGLYRVPFAVAAGCVLALFAALRPWRREPLPERRGPGDEPKPFEPSALLLPFAVAFCGMAFGGFSLLSASVPTLDFDANAYHLLGPKEWYLAGRIEFLRHNVYTVFPFLTEMWHLLGMTVLDNWAAGALVGQVLVWTFGPMGAVAAGVLARNCFGGRAGQWAALIYITTPWVSRLSAIPYVEGPLMFYTALAFLFAARPGGALLAGCLAGCAASCKYTGVFNTLIPAFAIVCFVAWRGRRILPPPASGGGPGRGADERIASNPPSAKRPLAAFALGASLFFAPWLVRNIVWTGNPVYPLAYSLFGGKNWTPEKAAKFAAGHRSNSFTLEDLSRYTLRPHKVAAIPSGGVFGEIPVRSDWQSGLVFAFLPLAWLHRNRRAAWWLVAIVAYEFLVFFFLTHRLDRFWLPLLPFAVALAGAGIAAIRGAVPFLWAMVMVGATIFGQQGYAVSGWCVGGQNPYQNTRNWYPNARVWGNPPVPPRGDRSYSENRTLLVGAADGFAGLGSAPIYNSVFDDCIFEQMFRAKPGEPATKTGLLANPKELRRRLDERGITGIRVDWGWIQTYRSVGNYGYTDFVAPEVVRELEDMNIIGDLYEQGPPGKAKLQMYRVVPETGQSNP